MHLLKNYSLQSFHEAAYLADDRQDLLNAINAFLDCSIVLPPSDFGGEDLLRSITHFQRDVIKKREEQETSMMNNEQKTLVEKGQKISGTNTLCLQRYNYTIEHFNTFNI